MEVENPLWIVGRVTSKDGWDFQGVFTERVLAMQACRDKTYFTGPVNLNEQLPHDSIIWPGVCWPKA